MKKKKYIKTLMSAGFERNLANLIRKSDNSSFAIVFLDMGQDFISHFEAGGDYHCSADESHKMLKLLRHEHELATGKMRGIAGFNKHVLFHLDEYAKHDLNSVFLCGREFRKIMGW